MPSTDRPEPAQHGEDTAVNGQRQAQGGTDRRIRVGPGVFNPKMLTERPVSERQRQRELLDGFPAVSVPRTEIPTWMVGDWLAASDAAKGRTA